MFDPLPTSTVQITTPTETPQRKIRAPKHDFKDGLGRVFAHRHVNGNGWVADTAKVDDKVHVGKRASIYHHAVITGNVIVQHHAQVCGAATITATNGSINITHAAIVGGRAEIASSNVEIQDCAKIFGGVISGDCKFKGYAEVRERPTIRNTRAADRCWIGGSGTIDNSVLRDNVRIYGEPTISNSTLRGWVVIKQNATITNSNVEVLLPPMSFYQGLTNEEIARVTNNTEIDGSCIIGGNVLVFYSNIHCTIHADGNTEFIRAKLRFSQPVAANNSGMSRYEILETNTEAKFLGVDFNNYNLFRANNVAFNATMRPAAMVAAARGQVFDFAEMSRPRRITAMEPK